MNRKKEKLANLNKRFRSTMEQVCFLLEKKSPRDIKRDEYIRHSVDNNIKNRLNKEELNAIGGFRLAKNTLFKKTEEELKQEETTLMEKYAEHMSSYGLTPTLKTMESWGFNISFINKRFQSLQKLYLSVEKSYPDVFQNVINDSIFTNKYKKDIKKRVKNSKVFFVSTAVSGKLIHEKSLKAIKSYLKKRNGELVILPSEDVASRKSTFDYELDSRLSGCMVVSEDVNLNNNIHLSSIKVSAKQINPITGLERLCQSKGSAILASPKQYLTFVPTSNIKLPHALMTTGAITVNDYSTDKYMSKRTSYIAEFDHVLGGLIVEIVDDSIYHFRQVQFDEDGSFYDLGTKYLADGSYKKTEESVCVFGDTHVGSHDIQINKELKKISKKVNCKEIIVHDIFDNRFNNHHDIGKPVLRGMMSKKGLTSLMKEGQITKDWLNDWSRIVNKITIVKSNHDEALDRYIIEGRWLNDPENLYDALPIVRAKMDGKDPLRFLIEDMCGLKHPDKIKWLNRDEDYVVYGIVNDAHGDKGANGSKGSMKSLEKSYFKATIGHSHTAGIFRNIYQVGTSTVLKLSYNSGPSSWTNTMCVQYPNGSRQLINIVRDKKGNVSFKL